MQIEMKINFSLICKFLRFISEWFRARWGRRDCEELKLFTANSSNFKLAAKFSMRVKQLAEITEIQNQISINRSRFVTQHDAMMCPRNEARKEKGIALFILIILNGVLALHLSS
jgi:hypothetical protein